MPIDLVPFALADLAVLSWVAAFVLANLVPWGREKRKLVVASACAISLFCGGFYVYRYHRVELLYGKAAAAGDAEAQYRLGRSLFFYGRGSAADGPRGYDLMVRAASQGHLEAALALASRYAVDCSPETTDRATEWLQQAAAQGHAESARILGVLQRDGVDWCREGDEVWQQIAELSAWH